MADLAAALTQPALRDRSYFKRWTVGLTLLIATLAIRWPTFGDPNYHIDEGFYLLVGQRMHDGLLPYVDMWDRKPFGLFALYWLITFFGEVHAYQIAAGLCVWLTAWIVSIIVARLQGMGPGILAAILYIAALEALAGGGGQSPIFYNLPIALAGLLTLDCQDGNDRRVFVQKAVGAMLLCGIAMTIKPTSLFEGVFFGLMLCLRSWKMGQINMLVRVGPVLVMAALLPTALCFGFFAALGHSATYFDATVMSIFATLPTLPADEARRIEWLLTIMFPVIILALTGLVSVMFRKERHRHIHFVAGWLLFAFVGFMAVPNYFDHYALPLVTSLAIASGMFVPVRIVGPVVAILATGWLLFVAGYPQIDRTNRSIASVAQAEALIRPRLGNGCLFAYDAPAVLYRVTDSCLPTNRIFSEHLGNAREANAIGTDPVVEVQRILAKHPTVIAIATVPTLNTPNQKTQKLVRDRLAAYYNLVGQVMLEDVVSRKPVQIWVLRQDIIH